MSRDGRAIAALAALAIGSAILVYLARGEDVQKLSTLNERTNLWALAWEKFTQRPMFATPGRESRDLPRRHPLGAVTTRS